jgi:hypothetical protein
MPPVGLAVLRHTWINVDLIWCYSLLGAGTVLLIEGPLRKTSATRRRGQERFPSVEKHRSIDVPDPLIGGTTSEQPKGEPLLLASTKWLNAFAVGLAVLAYAYP